MRHSRYFFGFPCVCVCLRVSVCLSAYLCVSVCLSVHARMCVCESECMCVCASVFMCVYLCVRLCSCACICVCVCVHVRVGVPPGAVRPAGDAPGEVVLAVVAPGVVEEVRPRREALAVDHPAGRLPDETHTGLDLI